MIKKIRKYIFLVVFCLILPAIVVWDLLPTWISDHPKILELVNRVAAVYMTVVATWLIISFANSLQKLSVNRSAAHQQYISSFVSILKIILIFVAVIIIISIIIDKDPTTLLAGLGAVSAILMLAFQDTIKGLVAGVRLASNDMLAVGDRITVPAAGADGIVEEIKLTTVKVRNFDNTIITITPQTLVDGSFQNWKGVKENVGRKAVRKVFFDFRSLKTDANGMVNLTRYRGHMEEWLAKNDKVLADKPILVHQLDATPTGLPVEFVFWLHEQDAIPYEHGISEIMEYAYAKADDYALRIYQQFPEQ
jgi:miniconductance mechanosensitive channel